MAKNVTALFKDRPAAEAAVTALTDRGFMKDDISVLMSATTQGREFGIAESSKAPEGAVTGAALGGALGAVLAGLAAVGAIMVPGLGLVAAGPILAALAGAGAGGAAGGLIGGLVGAGIPEHEAKLYSEKIEGGEILLGVRTHDDMDSVAKEILVNAGGEAVTMR